MLTRPARRPPLLQCPSNLISSCATYTTDGSSACICSTCSGGFTKSPNSLKCCTDINNCGTYDDATCKCSTCNSVSSVQQLLSATGAKCCAPITGCGTYNDADCKCGTCTTGVRSATGAKCCTAITGCSAYSDSDCSCTSCAGGELQPRTIFLLFSVLLPQAEWCAGMHPCLLMCHVLRSVSPAGFTACATRSNVCFKNPDGATALNGACCEGAVTPWTGDQCAGNDMTCSGTGTGAQCTVGVGGLRQLRTLRSPLMLVLC